MREESEALSGEALRLPKAAVADAGGQLGVHVSRAQVMQQSGISDVEEFVRIAECLAEQGCIDEGVNRYEFFVLTLRGIGAGTQGTEKP